MESSSGKPVVQDYMLKPGYIYLPERPTAISAVLGSSVSVCLFDKKLKTGGMNHFLFPRVTDHEKTTAMFGNIAVPTLINMMIHRGSKPRHLVAQVFGGAHNPAVSSMDIGSINISTARRILARKNVRVVSEDVGGEYGRKIIFNSTSFEIAVLKVEKLRESDWYPYEGHR